MVLALALAAVLWFVSGSPALRQRALAGASSWAEARFGVALTAKVTAASPFRGALRLEDLEVAPAGAEAFLAVDRLDVAISPWSLVRGSLRIRVLEINGATVDLERLPREWTKVGDDASGPTGPIDLPRADRIVVRDLTVHSLASLVDVDWLEIAELEGVAVDGSIEGQRLDLELVDGRLKIDTKHSVPLALALRGRLSRGSSGVMGLEDFELTSPQASVRLTASGTGSGDFTGEYRLEMDAGAVLLGEAGESEATAAGRFDLASRGGTVSFKANGQPLAVFGPFIADDLQASLASTVAVLDLEAELELENDEATGEFRAVARRAGVEVLSVAARPRLSIDSGSFESGFTGRAYAGRAGTRVVRGVLEIPDLNDPRTAVIRDGQLDLAVPDLAADLRFARKEWPDLVPAEFADVVGGVGVGSLSADVAFEGAVGDPSVRGSIEWRPNSSSAVTASFEGFPGRSTGALDAQFDRVPLDLFVADMSGDMGGSFAAATPGGLDLVVGDFNLVLPTLSTGGEAVASEVSLSGRTEAGMLVWSAKTFTPRFGTVAADGRFEQRIPLSKGDATLHLVSGPRALSRLEMEAHLEGGVLRLATSEPAAVFDTTATLSTLR